MKFEQRRLSTRTSFEFGDTELTYSVRDRSGERDFVKDYAEIPLGKRRVFDRNEWLRNVGLLWCLIGIANIGLGLYSNQFSLWSGFWLVIGSGCLAFYAFSKKSFTVIDVDGGPVFILEDKQFPTILAEIETRRKTRLYNLYGALNLENDPDNERGKIEWLVRQKVLSREEADLQLAQLRTGVAALPDPGKRLN